MLEQFNAPAKPATAPAPAPPPASTSTSTSAPAAPASSSKPAAPPRAQDPFGLDGLDDDFARELTKGMESLFRDIAQGAGLDADAALAQSGKSADGDADGDAEGDAREKAFRAAWEAMLVEGMNGTLGPEDVAGGAGPSGGAAAAAGTGAGAGSFQDNIKKTMEKLKESGHKVRRVRARAGLRPFAEGGGGCRRTRRRPGLGTSWTTCFRG